MAHLPERAWRPPLLPTVLHPHLRFPIRQVLGKTPGSLPKRWLFRLRWDTSEVDSPVWRGLSGPELM